MKTFPIQNDYDAFHISNFKLLFFYIVLINQHQSLSHSLGFSLKLTTLYSPPFSLTYQNIRHLIIF